MAEVFIRDGSQIADKIVGPRHIYGYTTNGVLVSRYLNNAAVNVNNSGAGTYVDFGGSFTTTITTQAGDQVHIVVQSIFNHGAATYAGIVVDRNGTKLPNSGANTSVQSNLSTSYIPFCLDIWNSPGAGAFTYKPQIYTSDANQINVGGGGNCQFVVELWR